MNTVNAFNNPIELGVRALMLLCEAHPQSLDIQRLVILDYLIVHSGDIEEGPPSLHPPSPLRAGEVAIRGELIERGIHVLATKGLLSRVVNSDGISYVAEELAVAFLDAISSTHGEALRQRAGWAVRFCRSQTNHELSVLLASSVGAWSSEFLIEGITDDL